MRRLRKMSGLEIAGRVRDGAIKQVWRVHACRPRPPAPVRPLPHGHFSLPRPQDLPLAPCPERCRAVCEEARRILGGRAMVLNHETTLLARHPDWFTDMRSGTRAPQDDYCFDIPYRDAGICGELKYVLEPSRHQHLTVLAAAYYLTGEESFAQRVADHLQSWWRENRFLRGIHWTSGIELGVRLISWVWLRRLLADWPPVSDLFENNPSFLRQLYQHQAYLARLPSHGSSANNHLIAELVGLFVAASAFPIFGKSTAWRGRAATMLARELERQIDAEGLNRELATAYHGFTLELFLTALCEDAATPVLGDEFRARVAAMADAAAAISDGGGRPPRQGDDDGAFALLVDGAGFDGWTSALATADAVFGGRDWWPARGGPVDLRTALFAARIGRVAPGRRAAQRRNHFPSAGLALLRDLHPRQDELWCRCDHGPLGYLATAAHGHADALSIEVRHGGVELFADPGTYCYHGHDEWRAYFRSTRGHNTLELDDVDQSRSGGTFLWLDRPTSRVETLRGLDGGDIAEWCATHDGYSRLTHPATHRRRVRLDRRARTIDIADSIDSGAAHPCRLSFHLGPHVECRLTGATARLSWNARGQAWTALLDLPEALVWTRVRGQLEPLAGWYSPGFGLVEPGTTLVGRGVLKNGQELQTGLSIRGAGDSVISGVVGAARRELAPVSGGR
ncbi:MAG TPA: alginate lyase family protein [Stellaceae bacterium]|nr:alginate lyase family protein [Stellaceae bacterium]